MTTVSGITGAVSSIGIGSGLDVTSIISGLMAAESAPLKQLQSRASTINSNRATFGATQSRFDAVIANLQQGAEAQSAARSRIMDADFATETSNLSRAQILQQAGNAMVAQANQLPQQVLKLLQ